jgi:parallel beta-helix repeat protein
MPLCATINVKDYGAQGNGAANDTAALNAALQAACAAPDSLYLPSGTYLTDSLNTLNGCGILFYGDGSSNSVLKIRSAVSPVLWRFAGGYSKSLTIQDLALDGGNSAVAGISIDQYQSVTINRIYVHDFGIPGYAAGHRRDLDGLYIKNTENVQVTNSQFTGNERGGVELQAVHNSTVSNSVLSGNGRLGGVAEQNFTGPLDGPLVAQWLNNTLANNGSGGIDVETDPNLPPAQGVLKGNQVLNCGNNQWDSAWGLVLGLHAFGTIEGNRVQNFAANTASGDYVNAIVYGANGGPISIANNTVVGTKLYAILGNAGAFPVTITGNTLDSNVTGVFIYESPGVQITNNTITNSSGAGIAVYWSDNSTISGNQLTGNLQNLIINGHGASQQ